MSVLLPDLERQLRAAIRSELPEPRRRRLRAHAGLLVAVLVTAAVLVVALQLRAGRPTAPARAPATAFGLAVEAPEKLLPPALRPGQYWYQRSVEVKPAVEVVRYRGQLLQLPEIRHSLYESWLGTDLRSSAREVEIGTPVFPNAQDRAIWLASGSPTAPPFDYSTTRNLPWLKGGYATPRSLPTQPSALLRLGRQTGAAMFFRPGQGPVDQAQTAAFEFHGLISLLEVPASIATRRALLDAIAMVPGVSRRTGVTDLIGRRGTSLTLLGDTMIYDPASTAILGEDSKGAPALKLNVAYIASGVVDTRGGLPEGISAVK